MRKYETGGNEQEMGWRERKKRQAEDMKIHERNGNGRDRNLRIDMIDRQ